MSLYVRVNCNFFTHRKTRRLKNKLGTDAFWIPPRLWAYAADNHPDGILADYSADELAEAIGYTGDADRMLQALLEGGFLDENPLRIHDWVDYNGYHKVFAERAKAAAEARWRRANEKKQKKEIEEKTGEEPSNASSMLGTHSPDVAGAIGKAEKIGLERQYNAVFERIKEIKKGFPEKKMRPPELQAALESLWDEETKLIAQLGWSSALSTKPKSRSAFVQPANQSVTTTPVTTTPESTPQRVQELAEQARRAVRQARRAATK
jgi:hypothetical protein